MKRRRIDDYEKQRIADRLRAIMAAAHLSEMAVSAAIGVDQPFVSRLLAREYEFETPKVAQVISYVNMQKMSASGSQLELPFEAAVAIQRFLRARGDIDLLTALIDVLASKAGRRL